MLESGVETYRAVEFKQWMQGVLLFSLQPFAIEDLSLEEARGLNTSGSNFVSYFRRFAQEDPGSVGKVVADLREIIPGLQFIRTIEAGPGRKVLRLACKGVKREFEVLLSELSEGQRALLVLYTILHSFSSRARLLVFDEPDNFVAQSEMQPWLSAMREALVDADQGTLLVISHHPEVIDYLAPDQTLYLWRDVEGPARLREVELDREQGVKLSEWLSLGNGYGT